MNNKLHLDDPIYQQELDEALYSIENEQEPGPSAYQQPGPSAYQQPGPSNQLHGDQRNHGGQSYSRPESLKFNFAGMDWCVGNLDEIVITNNHNMANLVCYLKGEVIQIKNLISQYKTICKENARREVEQLKKILVNKDTFVKHLEKNHQGLVNNKRIMDQKYKENVSKIANLERIIEQKDAKIDHLKSIIKNLRRHNEEMAK